MPLALAPDGKGWVRVPPPRRRKPTAVDTAELMKTPLAYFACTPVPSSKPRIPNIPVYTLDPNEHTPPGSAATGNGRPRKKAAGQRAASSPHHGHPYDEEYGYSDHDDSYDVHPHHQQHQGRRTRPPPQSTISHERVRPRHTPGAVIAAQAASARSGGLGSSPPKPRAATTTSAAGGGGYSYWTGPSNKARAPPPRNYGGDGGSSVGSGGSGKSARWANATAPLAL
ncbi:uncharacterized protein AB675_8596 [Cyphellophora attinorum]|uniref:Uncharacterized protein n=1 Tax=Cyphellophora attinorum TaxID=1664694 RepID=A0A0N1HA53_9EURO|nr:uncharacterized protein AB675_8596 [Phialophora attinorum]KPI44626.1 hypothetical protein AB675_8596 [Phialophora attinorum]